jgi:hypothetical protein
VNKTPAQQYLPANGRARTFIIRHSLCVLFIVTVLLIKKINLMAEIHVHAKRPLRSNPSWMWFWVIVGILIIASVAYYVYANKDKDASNNQDLKNQRNTPMPGASAPQPSTDKTYVMHIA